MQVVFSRSDLVTYFLTQHNPILNLGLDFVKMNILSKFEQNWDKNVVSRVLTSIFQNLT